MAEKRSRDSEGGEKKSKKSKHEGESKEERRARKEAKKSGKTAVVVVPPQHSPEDDGNNGDVEMVDGNVSASTRTSEMVALIKTLPGAMVPFANPLADEKTQKKVLKNVKKGARTNALKRGVKEVVKAVRKSPLAATPGSHAPGIVVLAADISPMDVISHIPVMCEDHGIPYIYVPSRAELGAAGSTKRPTSVIMVTKDGKARKPNEKSKDKDEKDVDPKEWAESYAELLKVVERAGRTVKI